MADEQIWILENIEKLTEEEYQAFLKHNSDMALAEYEIAKICIAVKKRLGEVAE